PALRRTNGGSTRRDRQCVAPNWSSRPTTTTAGITATNRHVVPTRGAGLAALERAAFGSWGGGGAGALRGGLIAGPLVVRRWWRCACPSSPADTKVQTSFPRCDLGKHLHAEISRTTRV